MQVLASAYAAQPIAFTATVLLVVGALVTMAFRIHAMRSQGADPLNGLFQSHSFENKIDEVERSQPDRRLRPRSGTSGGAVLHARVDHFAQVGQIWGKDTRAEAIDQVARVMRAGIRSSDGFETEMHGSAADNAEGTFIIHANGANEQEANEIAQRLLKTLANTPVPGMGDDIRLTASFGVAEQRSGEDQVSLYARANAALKAAQTSGEDEVVAASEWEEIKMLPAPAPSDLKDGSEADRAA